MMRSPTAASARSIRMSETGASRMSWDLLPVGPALAARTVPVGNLVGVQIVARGEFHRGLVRGSPAGFAGFAAAAFRSKFWQS